MRAMGAPEKAIAATHKDWSKKFPPPDPIEVFPENVEAFEVFWTVRPQWEMPGGQGGRCTVPFSDVDIAISRLRIRKPRDCFKRVGIMLLAARSIFTEQHEQRVKAASKRRR